MSKPPRKRANVYFDGFNFYHGCFRDSGRPPTWQTCKWLNLRLFCERVFPNFDINRIRYFTALVNPTPLDPDIRLRQQTYLRALETIPKLTVHRGRFATNKKKRWLADPRSSKPTPRLPLQTVEVIEQEEKGSDVNLASYLLIDAFAQEYDIAVVVSNDSDLVTPITLVRTVLGRQIALLNPRPKTAQDLQGIADIYRDIRFGSLQACQFPPILRDANGTITKPSTW
jgi:uncharacterized LabA/DUF88 family protein